MSAIISSIVAFIVAGLAIFGLVPHQRMQPLPQQAVQQPTNAITSTSAAQSSLKTSVAITNVSGRTITVEYANLSETAEGPTPPKLLSIQSDDFSKPLLQVDIEGGPNGTKSFTMPTGAPAGNYSITPIGIPTKPYVGGVGPGWLGYGVLARFKLSASGSITVGEGQ